MVMHDLNDLNYIMQAKMVSQVSGADKNFKNSLYSETKKVEIF